MTAYRDYTIRVTELVTGDVGHPIQPPFTENTVYVATTVANGDVFSQTYHNAEVGPSLLLFLFTLASEGHTIGFVAESVVPDSSTR